MQEQATRAAAAAGLGILVIALAPVSGAAALLGGALLGALLGRPAWAATQGQRVLKWSIVGLGGAMTPAVVLTAGATAIGPTALTLLGVVIAGLGIGMLLRLPRDLILLVTFGTAICGGSAIAATAPVLRARDSHIASALGVVFLLNAIALFAFPWLGTALGLSAETYGTWCALAIHDTSSVAGASAAHGALALETAAVTKMVRSLWILPVVIALGLTVTARDGEQGARARFPWFILGFVAVVALVGLLPALRPAGEVVATLARRGLNVALFLVGMGLQIRSLQPRALLLGTCLWIGLATTTLAILA
ncbi:MAG: putative sulfate exporter family transporter [Planctomycetota bacterium]